MILLMVIGNIIVALLVVYAVHELLAGAVDRRRAVHAADVAAASTAEPLVVGLDRRFRATRFGRWLERELEVSGVQQRPVVVLAVVLGVSLVATYLLWTFLAPTLAVVGILAGYLALRWYLEREQNRRREAFVGQLPELARILANASYAGLSLPTAIAIAGDEMTEPARGELGRVATRLKFGAPLVEALEELQDRVGTRETNVLISTLVVSSRSGGSLVAALRDIAKTLDQRKETRREIQTTLAQAIATSYMVIFLGGAMLLLLNVIQGGTVQKMTTHPVGQVGLVAATLLFAGGFVAMRRVARVEP